VRSSASLSACVAYGPRCSGSMRWAASRGDDMAEMNQRQLSGHPQSANADVHSARRSVVKIIAAEDAHLWARAVVVGGPMEHDGSRAPLVALDWAPCPRLPGGSRPARDRLPGN
jgi:hypothetical protein